MFLDSHELWRSMMSICLLTEVKWQWAMLILGWLTTLVHYAFIYFGAGGPKSLSALFLKEMVKSQLLLWLIDVGSYTKQQD